MCFKYFTDFISAVTLDFCDCSLDIHFLICAVLYFFIMRHPTKAVVVVFSLKIRIFQGGFSIYWESLVRMPASYSLRSRSNNRFINFYSSILWQYVSLSLISLCIKIKRPSLISSLPKLLSWNLFFIAQFDWFHVSWLLIGGGLSSLSQIFFVYTVYSKVSSSQTAYGCGWWHTWCDHHKYCCVLSTFILGDHTIALIKIWCIVYLLL